MGGGWSGSLGRLALYSLIRTAECSRGKLLILAKYKHYVERFSGQHFLQYLILMFNALWLFQATFQVTSTCLSFNYLSLMSIISLNYFIIPRSSKQL